MEKKNSDDEVFSLEEVFAEEQVIQLSLSAEAWEIIIALAESGGQRSFESLIGATGHSADMIQEVVKPLLDIGVVSLGPRQKPSETAAAAPDAEVSQYLEYLRDLNHYQVLQIQPNVDKREIKKAYFKLMREYSPDRFMSEKNPDTKDHLKEIFRVLTVAYETLSDDHARHEYDQTIPDFTGMAEEPEAPEPDLAAPKPEAAPAQANPELAQSFFDNAMEDLQKSKHKNARVNLKLAVNMDPENLEYQAELSRVENLITRSEAKDLALKAIYLEDDREVGKAIQMMKKAVDLAPEVVEYRYDLARLMETYTVDLATARVNVLMALDRHPGKVPYLLLFAKIQVRLGETRDAKRTLKKVLSLDSENQMAKNALIKLQGK